MAKRGKGAKGGRQRASVFVDLLVVIFLISALLGTIAGSINTMEADTGNFSTAEIAVLGLLTILIVIGVLYVVLDMTGVA